MKIAAPRIADLTVPRRRLKSPTSAVTLWRPEIVLATSVTAPPARPAVAVAEPGARPGALRHQLDEARSLLTSLDGARETLGATVARARPAASEREAVSATIAAYRAEAALDDALTGVWRRVSALMEARGLR